MIYLIDNQFYVKVGSKYSLISVTLDEKGEIVLKPMGKRIENNSSLKVEPYSVSARKEEIISLIRPKCKSEIKDKEEEERREFRTRNREYDR